MQRQFVYTQPFVSAWKHMGLQDEDLPILENCLLEDPLQGPVIDDTGIRKLRIQLEGRGKRGGARVIYLDILERGSIYLLFAYPKNVQSDLTPDQKKALHKLVKMIKEE